MSDNRSVDVKEAIEALAFEPGKEYVVFVDAGVIDAKDLMELQAPAPDSAEVTFVFCIPMGRPVRDSILCVEAKPDTVVFVQEGMIDEKVERPGLRILTTPVSPHWALAEYRRAAAGWVPDHIPMIPIRGGHMRWDEETDREYFLRIVESVQAAERERAAKIAENWGAGPADPNNLYPDASDACKDIATKIRSVE